MARIFVSYSHRDEAWKERVVQQLGVPAGEGLSAPKDGDISENHDLMPEYLRR